MIVSLHPRGGPTLGGTRVTVTGRGFSPISPSPICRFGENDDIGATLVNSTRIICEESLAAPPAKDDAAVHRLALEISIDGGATFTRSGRSFTYIDFTQIHISSVTPSGGPRNGGTIITVAGHGFRDLGGSFGADVQSGLLCSFGDNLSGGASLVDH